MAVAWQKIGAVLVLALDGAAVFWFLFQRTKIGLAMRAVAVQLRVVGAGAASR